MIILLSLQVDYRHNMAIDHQLDVNKCKLQDAQKVKVDAI